MNGEHPEMNQIEMHPFLPQENLVSFCRQHQILLTAYSPLGSPDSRAERHQNDPKLLTNPIVEEIAQKHQVTCGQILLAWSIQRGIAVIPKSVNPQRIQENLEAASLALSKEDLDKLNHIGITHRFVDGTFFTGSNSPYTQSDLWDMV
jgi:alcohol dehydrogenase (NADP+)